MNFGEFLVQRLADRGVKRISGVFATNLESALTSQEYGRPSRASTRYSTPPTSIP